MLWYTLCRGCGCSIICSITSGVGGLDGVDVIGGDGVFGFGSVRSLIVSFDFVFVISVLPMITSENLIRPKR